MPESAAKSAERKRLAREADRRREAAAALRLAATVSNYAAGQLADGLTPAQARQAAEELAGVAAELRRLARLSAAPRRRPSPRSA